MWFIEDDMRFLVGNWASCRFCGQFKKYGYRITGTLLQNLAHVILQYETND